jgi:hypothetical protein
MAYNVSVRKGGIELGTGSMANGSATVSSYTAAVAGNTPAGKNVQISATGGNNTGAHINTRVLVDDTTSLTLNDAGPYS